ncbi:unnamed protein product, partial [Ilex paraguariensis]
VIFIGWKLRSVQIVAVKAVGGLFYCCYWLEVAVRVMFLLTVFGSWPCFLNLIGSYHWVGSIGDHIASGFNSSLPELNDGSFRKVAL